jgi:hypothetical protein
MRELVSFQVKQHKTLEDIVVKHEVNEKVLPVKRKALLP